jgi:hypothetical protein
MLMLTHWVSYFRRPSAPSNRSVRKVGASDVRDAAGEAAVGVVAVEEEVVVGATAVGAVAEEVVEVEVEEAAAAAADAVEGAEEAVVVAENRIIR